MIPLHVRSFAKVNLALAVLGKRPDGYHEIRTVFQSIDLHDVLELRPAPSLRLECPGLAGVPVEQNLVWKAAVRAPEDRIGPPGGAYHRCTRTSPQVRDSGGGSSNAAATLLGLQRLWGIGAARIGAQGAWLRASAPDVPFFLQGGTALGIGRGDEIYPLPEIAPSNLLVIYPGEGVSTAEAYESLRFGLTSQSAPIECKFLRPLAGVSACATGIFNDFETSILPACPAIREAKEAPARAGGAAARDVRQRIICLRILLG